jgi:enediyne biosynthesis protein E7
MSGRAAPSLEGNLGAADVQRAPLEFLADLAERFGDVAGYTVDGRRVILVNHPDHARHVLQERHRIYAKQDTPDLMMLKPMLGDGLLTTDGEQWLRQRRMAAPAFHRDRVEGFARLMVEETHVTLGRWASHARDGDTFEAGDELTQLTTRVVSRALFGADLSHLVESFGDAVQAMNEFMGHYDPGDRTRLQRFLQARALIDSMVREIIAQRRRDHAAGEADRGDFLSVLLAATDEDGQPLDAQAVRDQVMTLLMAGHETTAKALTWSLYLLDRHPQVLRQLEAEVTAVLGGADPSLEDLPKLPLAWQVLQEAMRLYPPVWIIARTALADDVIGGWSVPAGTLVLVSPWLLHRHPGFWEEPDAFRPERFAGDAEQQRHPFAFVPFSGGPRQCIGRHFARLEAHISLVMMTSRYRVRTAAADDVVPEALVTLRPRGGLHVSLQRVEAVP